MSSHGISINRYNNNNRNNVYLFEMLQAFYILLKHVIQYGEFKQSHSAEKNKAGRLFSEARQSEPERAPAPVHTSHLSDVSGLLLFPFHRGQ